MQEQALESAKTEFRIYCSRLRCSAVGTISSLISFATCYRQFERSQLEGPGRTQFYVSLPNFPRHVHYSASLPISAHPL